MTAAKSCDVAIVGGGPVGAALAIALARSELAVALIEGRQPAAPDLDNRNTDNRDPDHWDTRVYAVSPGSRAFLATLGAWQHLDAARIASIAGMQVWGDDGHSSIAFDALAAGREDLGCIVEAGRLQTALWEVLRDEPGITLYCPARCESLTMDGPAPRLGITGGETMDAALIVGADGPDSWVRRAAGLVANVKPYAQTAVVANFATELPHGGIARQWFRADGVLAWLPLSGNRISIVWSAETAVANDLLELDAAAFAERVAAAGQHLLGQLDLITPPASFPLRRIDLPQTVKPGLALLGDAAHVVHPLAGQGVNLGFRDAQALALVLLGRGRHERLGDLPLLRRYERARREDWLATKWVTDGLHALFQPGRRGLAGLGNLGLNLTDRSSRLKRRFMAHAMQ